MIPQSIIEYFQMSDKEREHARIAEQTERFLDRGGRIARIGKLDVSLMPVNLAGDFSDAVEFLRG